MNLLQILIASCILASMVTASGNEVGKQNQNKINEALMNSVLTQKDPATKQAIEVSDENKSRLREALMDVDEKFGDKLSADEITNIKMKVLFEYVEKIYVYKKTKEIAARFPKFKGQDPDSAEVNLLLDEFYSMSLKNVYADVKENLKSFLMNLLDSLKPYWENIKNLFKPKKMVEKSVASVIDTLKEQDAEAYRKVMIEQANSNGTDLSQAGASI
jgi:uncharacterized membrane-anchored protein YjiN (DUF445 family)